MGDCTVSLRPCVSETEEPLLQQAPSLLPAGRQGSVLLAQAGPVRPPVVTSGQYDLSLARHHFEQGEKLFRKKKFQEAIAEFQKAFDLSGLPKLLYNIALCQQKLGKNREAAASYRAYLKALPDAPNKKDVEVEIGLLEKKLAAAETTALAEDPTLPPLVPLPLPARGDESPADHPDPSTGSLPTAGGQTGRRPPAEPGADGMPPREVLVPPPTIPNPQNAPLSHRFLMWTSVAIGAAGLAAGGLGLYLANSREAEYAGLVRRMKGDGRVIEREGRLVFSDPSTESAMRPRLKGLEDSGQMFEGLGWGATISGSAFVGLAVTLWFMEPDQKSPVKKGEESSPSLSALVDSGTVFVAIEKRF